MPYVYLVQPATLVGTNRYKIGMSGKSSVSRLSAYHVGTRLLAVNECIDVVKKETELIRIFNSKFKLIAGHEYFVVEDMSEYDLIDMFHEIVMGRYTHDAPINFPIETNQEAPFEISDESESSAVSEDSALIEPIEEAEIAPFATHFSKFAFKSSELTNAERKRIFNKTLWASICEYTNIAIKDNYLLLKTFYTKSGYIDKVDLPKIIGKYAMNNSMKDVYIDTLGISSIWRFIDNMRMNGKFNMGSMLAIWNNNIFKYIKKFYDATNNISQAQIHKIIKSKHELYPGISKKDALALIRKIHDIC